MEKKKNLKTAIIVLAVLLGVSIAALSGILIYNRFAESQPASVTVPENIITPKTENSGSSGGSSETESEGTSPQSSNPESSSQSTSADRSEGSGSTDAEKLAKALRLHERNPGDNTPFKAGNMFPGDAETEYYCIKVSYKDTVTVRFRADVRPGFDKLAEVLKCRVVLLSSGETLYDGLMRDMPESVNHTLKTGEKTTDELYYEITAYLDTSVGSEYMEKDLISDFRWWVQETENLEPPPQTGDTSSLVLWACLAAGSLLVLILLAKKRRKEAEQYGR